MLKGGRSMGLARRLASSEIQGEKRAKTIEIFLLSITLISTSAFLILLTSHFLSTGYATYLESQAGTITEVTIEKAFPTTFWDGVYGLALRVQGFSELLSKDFSNEIAREDLFFDCLNPEPAGGSNEIYASVSPTIDF